MKIIYFHIFSSKQGQLGIWVVKKNSKKNISYSAQYASHWLMKFDCGSLQSEKMLRLFFLQINKMYLQELYLLI